MTQRVSPRRENASTNWDDGEARVIKPVSLSSVIKGIEIRESILVAAKDKVGKTTSILAMCLAVIERNPFAMCWIIDTENGVPPVAKSWEDSGIILPDNVQYFHVQNMNENLQVFDYIMESKQPGDWIFVDSMAKVWEMAQDLGYKAITGMLKQDYLAERRAKAGGKRASGSPIPAPDQFWNIVKDAHDGNFMDPMIHDTTLNFMWVSGTTKPSDREKGDRKNFRLESGIDMSILGAPRLPYQVDTVIVLERQTGRIVANVLGDRHSIRDEPAHSYKVGDRLEFGRAFFAQCRGVEIPQLSLVPNE
jgi:hypothetical protein